MTPPRNFSNGKPVDSVDTETSRIILHELEKGWWILVSIDLTRLPQSTRPDTHPHIEYSTREVAPAQLLLQQLLRAHSLFLLHHAAKLEELYHRVGRSIFTSLLERYWTSFARDWDVMLHGNPVADIYNGIKLAAGGELGIGVGEEEWGSGEREVLEDFVTRTDGLMDLIVSRFGDAPTLNGVESPAKASEGESSKLPPWLGTDADPRSTDGVIFSGTGAISRRSLATVSQWMEAIFKSEEGTYGVGENPNNRHRHKRRKMGFKKSSTEDPSALRLAEGRFNDKGELSSDPDLRREAMKRNAAPPGIPPSLVPILGNASDNAVSNVNGDTNSAFGARTTASATDQDSSLFDAEKMMGYLKLGYGSSWTLSAKGLPGNKVMERNPQSDEPNNMQDGTSSDKHDSTQPGLSPLQEVDPAPEVSDTDDSPFIQRLEQSIGKFIIGLAGDLENTEFGDDGQGETEGDQEQTPQRLFLRILTVEMTQSRMGRRRHSKASEFSGVGSASTYSQGDEPPTSASASVDGARSIINHQKVQVAVYVHQPFIFVFLFQLHTPSLTMPSFYRSIHHRLGPLQKPLLASTDPGKVALRMADAMGESSSTTTTTTTTGGAKQRTAGQTIYDIIYDPIRLTVRTSIPNIPIPGSLAAEGLGTITSGLTISGSWYTLGIPIGSTRSTSSRNISSLVKSDWTRVEALNIHTQMLSTWIATRNAAEVERTVKTGKGWWILWMQISDTSYNQPKKEAFLVRKASDHKVSVGSSIARNTSGKWLLREQIRDSSGSSLGSTKDQITTSAGVSEGVGVDAGRWVEGLLHLSR
jgi:hypothetical protein